MIYSFAPIAEANARCLILGSIPGKASLQANQYYAHPRNQFWPLMTQLLAGDLNWDYQQRCQMLIEHRIALWDVLQSCRRHSSLDADIEPASMVSNQFVEFFAEHPQIESVFFNGTTAKQSFKRQVLPNLERELRLIKLPSTSPAHAAMNFEQKLQQWRVLVDAA